MDKVRDYVRTIFEVDDDANVLYGNNKKVLFWSSLLLAFVSLVLTALNVLIANWFMTAMTTSLAVALLASSILAYLNHLHAASILIMLACAVNFSIYAIFGQNDGFAILWILLIPILGMMVVGIRYGFFLSLYFLIFLVVLFYTPLSAYVASYYTETFMMRFPILYLATFVAVTFLMIQINKMEKLTFKQAVFDNLTGLYNRHRFNALTEKIDVIEEFPDLTLIVIDINRLKWVNDNQGHAAGDEMIVAAASIIKQVFPDAYWFRTGGDEFLVVSEQSDISEQLLEMHELVSQWHGEHCKDMSISTGVASRSEFPEASCIELNQCADTRMLESKRCFYSEKKYDRRKS